MELMPSRVIARIVANMPDPKRLLVLDRLYRDRLDDLHRATQRAVQWNRDRKTLQEDGRIRVNVWSRDCDCVEGWHTYVVPVADLNRRIEQDLAYADGPMSHSLARPSEVPQFPRPRDRILEAFEDGHPWSV